MVDIISLPAQLLRSYNYYTGQVESSYGSGNVPVAFSEFVAASTALLKATTEIAAGYTDRATGSALALELQPLTNALAGLGLASNIFADVTRLAQAMDAGDSIAADRAALQLMASTFGALVFAARAFALGNPLFLAASTGYLVGGIVLPPLINFLKDPLVLDLDGDGIELSSLADSTVHFDFEGDGFAERTGWVSSDDGILAIDDNENGNIDNGLEIFGSSTQDGYAVLEKLDANGDGKIWPAPLGRSAG